MLVRAVFQEVQSVSSRKIVGGILEVERKLRSVQYPKRQDKKAIDKHSHIVVFEMGYNKANLNTLRLVYILQVYAPILNIVGFGQVTITNNRYHMKLINELKNTFS